VGFPFLCCIHVAANNCNKPLDVFFSNCDDVIHIMVGWGSTLVCIGSEIYWLKIKYMLDCISLVWLLLTWIIVDEYILCICVNIKLIIYCNYFQFSEDSSSFHCVFILLYISWHDISIDVLCSIIILHFCVCSLV
jgi:hypothetical protein